MDALRADEPIDPETRFDLLTSIVPIARGAEAPPVEIAQGFGLAGTLGEERLVLAMVDAVPAGIYGKAVPESLGVREEVEPKVAQAPDMRGALALVSRGEAPMGVVHAMDAVAGDDATVVGRFRADTRSPIVYPAAAVDETDTPLNADVLAFLRRPEARAAFGRQGFGIIPERRQSRGRRGARTPSRRLTRSERPECHRDGRMAF